MNNRDLLIDFLNYCQEKREMPEIDDDNTYLVDDYFLQQNLKQCNVSGMLPVSSIPEFGSDEWVNACEQMFGGKPKNG